MNKGEYKTPQSDSSETPDHSWKRSLEIVNDKYGEVLKKLAENENQEKEGAD